MTLVKRIQERFVVYRRIQRLKQLQKEKEHNSYPLMFEFVGVAGVGKSTLCKSLPRHKYTEWVEADELLSVLPSMPEQSEWAQMKVYQKLTELKTKNILKEDISPMMRLYYLSIFKRVLFRDARISMYNYRFKVIVDEGLLHNYGWEIAELQAEEPEWIENFIKNRAIIFCYAAPEVIADRILERNRRTDKVLFFYKDKTREELISIIKTGLESQREFINYAINFIPILQVNTEEDINLNVNKIIHFVCNEV